jgi:type IV secretory pathway VirB10-like protein
MTQLDDHTRRMLLAVDDPPSGMQDRIYRAIVVGGGPPDGSAGDAGAGAGGGGLVSSGALDVGFAAKVVGATIGLTSAGVALLALTGMGIRAMNPVEPSKDRVVVEERSAGESKRASTAVEPEPIEPPAVTTVAVEPTPPPEPQPSATTAEAEPAPSGSTLEAELAVMAQAREAKSPKDKLAALEQHRDEFRDGVLADEREVMRIEALCALGRVDEAEQAAATFIAAKPKHPLRSRVDPACPP